MSTLESCLIICFAPLLGSLIAGLFRRQVGKIGATLVTVLGVAASFLLSCVLAKQMFTGQISTMNLNLYTWADGGSFFPYAFHVGFLIDPLTVLMLLVVTFVSLLVHIYSIGYMDEDPGYQRFFSYISLFTFMMLMLVTGNNFLQLFFGWEGVGLVSYLLIGFWYDKESAIQGSLKAFLVNRVGDFGFILGIGLILAYAGSLDYATVFAAVGTLTEQTITLFGAEPVALITVICICLFIGAMGKSAQVPLHVWLPESMEGPTPISALIHAATMVTAGVFMLARVSPLLEHSETCLSFILVIGATGALFTGILALVMNDIKRVVAYSTLSQLGYMMVAMGCSAFSAGIFHLATHACFKALLFLAAGSVILGMHHEQDMRKMGGLWKKMPITYLCFLIGNLALCAIPPFAGFFSKDTIIEVAGLTHIPGAKYAYFCVVLGAMITAIYSFRSLFMTFHGKPRMSAEDYEHVHESSWVVLLPLILLAIPSVVIGYLLYMPMLFEGQGLLAQSLFVAPELNGLAELAKEVHGPLQSALEALHSPIFYLSLSGIFLAWLGYVALPSLPAFLAKRFSWIYRLLMNKYGFDGFNDLFFMRGSRALGQCFYRIGDQKMIDGLLVNGTAKTFAWVAAKGRLIQSGYLYHYVTVMVLSLLAFLCWFLLA